jgi:hypothetical protein
LSKETLHHTSKILQCESENGDSYAGPRMIVIWDNIICSLGLSCKSKGMASLSAYETASFYPHGQKELVIKMQYRTCTMPGDVETPLNAGY